MPPASSDRRKWWLDNGLPARSTVKPPSNRDAPNPARPSNPYTPSPEPDWVRVEKPEAPPSRPSSVYSNISQSTVARSETTKGDAVPPRKLPPSSIASSKQDSLAPEKPPRPATFDGASSSDGKVHLKQTLRKPAPPPKPSLLRVTSNQSAASVQSSAPPPPEPRRAKLTPSNTSSSSMTFPPPPRQAINGTQERAAQSPVPQPPAPRRKAATDAGTSNPPLPPRQAATGLMDEGNGQEELKDWKPLQPQ